MIKLVLKRVLQTQINTHGDISAMVYKMNKALKKYQFGFFIEKFTALKISFEKRSQAIIGHVYHILFCFCCFCSL